MAVNASVQVDDADVFGILITNGEFTAFLDPGWGNTTADHTQVVVSATNTGAVRFVNSAFWGPSNQIAKIAGTGTAGFADCTFSYWDAVKAGRYAIQAQGGNVFVNSNDFQMDGNQVLLESSVSKAVISANIVKGKVRIETNGANSQVALNVGD